MVSPAHLRGTSSTVSLKAAFLALSSSPPSLPTSLPLSSTAAAPISLAWCSTPTTPAFGAPTRTLLFQRRSLNEQPPGSSTMHWTTPWPWTPEGHTAPWTNNSSPMLVGSTLIYPQDELFLLVVKFDRKLSIQQHLQLLTGTARSLLAMTKRLHLHLPHRQQMQNMVRALVMGRLCYGSILFTPHLTGEDPWMLPTPRLSRPLSMTSRVCSWVSPGRIESWWNSSRMPLTCQWWTDWWSNQPYAKRGSTSDPVTALLKALTLLAGQCLLPSPLSLLKESHMRLVLAPSPHPPFSNPRGYLHLVCC